MTSTLRPASPLAALRQLRPHQWTKNLLVFAPVAAAGNLGDTSLWLPLCGAFVAMALAASSTYVINDLHDVESDRNHPAKRLRPLASGAISVTTGWILAASTGVSALLVAAALGWETFAAVVVYLGITFAYSNWLKEVPVLELVVVAVGFPLRAIVGGLATDTPLTTNFLLVVGFGAVFVVGAKRAAELQELADVAEAHRTTLGAYSPGYLRLVQEVAASVMLVVYGLWTFGGEVSSSADSTVWFQLSMLPVVVAVLRYAWLVDRGEAGAPEEVFQKDRAMQLIALLWLGLYGIGVSLA